MSKRGKKTKKDETQLEDLELNKQELIDAIATDIGILGIPNVVFEDEDGNEIMSIDKKQ